MSDAREALMTEGARLNGRGGAWLRPLLVLVLIGAAAIVPYARTVGFGLASDDYQWLAGARQFDPAHLLSITGRSHFYRPVMELYFPAAVAVCGPSAPCYHWLSIALHIGTSLLVVLLVRSISGVSTVGVLAGILFAVQPGPVEAVTWVSAVSEIVATAFFILTVWLFRRATEGAGRVSFMLSLVTFAACLLTHESGVTLLPLLVLSVWLLPTTAPPAPASSMARQLLKFAPFTAILAAYAVVAYLVNSRNYVVTEGHYAVGGHAVTNILGALVSMVVGRREALGLVLIGAFFAWAATVAPRRIRFFALWTLITLAPFAFFRGGLASRYLYLSAVGFAALAAQCLWWPRATIARWPRVGPGVWWVITVLLTLRFASFAVKNVQGWQNLGRAFGQYAAMVREQYPAPPEGARLEVPPPPTTVSEIYVQPLLQWEFADPTLTAVVRRR